MVTMTKNIQIRKLVVGLCSCMLITLVTIPGSLLAAEDKKDGAEKPTPPPPPPFIKAPISTTKYTKNCKPMGLQKAPKDQKRRTFALDPGNFRRMEKASEFMGEEQYDEAIVILKELAVRAENRPYDLAKAKEYMGYAYLSKGNYDVAIKNFRDVIDQRILPVRNEQSLIRNVAGLYLAIDPPEVDKAMSIISDWFKTAVKPKPSDYILLGQAAVLGKKYVESICPVRMAINISDRPKNSWFDILVAAHFELEDFEGAAAIAEERLLSFPGEGKYWRQLSGLKSKLEKMNEALILLELAHKQGHLKKGSEYRNLASMYSINELTYKAARILQEGLDKGIIESTEKHWKQAAVNWQISRESNRAVKAYSKAGSFAEHGINELRIGTILSEKEDWKEAVKYFRKALSKGGLKKSEEGRTHMSLGIALHNAGKSSDAIKALKKAQGFKSVERNASQWINYVRDAMKYASN